MLVVQPQFGISKADIMGLVNGIFLALAFASINQIKKSYDVNVIILVFLLVGSFIPLFCIFITEFIDMPTYFNFLFTKFILPNLSDIPLIILLGILGFFQQSILTKAYAFSKSASKIETISYSDIISIIFGMMMGDSLPNMIAFGEIALIIASGMLISLRKLNSKKNVS